MKTTTRTALMGSSAMFNARPGFSPMLRGPAVAYAAENEGGAEGQGDQGQAEGDKAKQPEAIDPAKYQSLASAHDRLKKDAAADRTALNDLKERLSAFEAKEAKLAEDAARANGDFDTVKTQLETRFNKEIETRDAKLAKSQTQIERLVVKAGLSSAIAAAGVAPEFVDAVTALLRQGVEIREEDDEPVAYRGGMPLAEAVKLWAETDGKAFIRNGNSGGGAQGGGGSSSALSMKREDFDKLDAKARAAKMAEPGFKITD
jgi:hypothetical protein